MTSTRYIPGDWYALVDDGKIVLLSPETLPEIVELVWTSLRSGEDLETQLELLTSGPARSIPAFALVSGAQNRMRSYLRGDVRLTVRGGELESAPGVATEITIDKPGHTRPAVFTGGTVHPWVTVVVQSMDECWLSAPDARVGDVSLPILSGVVQVAEVGFAAERSASDTAGPEHAAVEFDEELDGQTIMDPEYLARVRAQAQLLDQPSGAPTAESVPLPEPDSMFEPDSASEQDAAPEPEPEPEPEVEPEPAPAPATPEPARPVPPPPAQSARPMQASARLESEEDHDGLTIMSSDLVAIRAQMSTGKQNPAPRSFPVPAAQENHPTKLLMSSGLVVTLDRTILIGRAPVVSRVSNRDLPRVITVESPNADISRTHAQVRTEGQRTFVTDLNSTNGVMLLKPGAEPQRLKPGVPTDVSPDVTIDIGDGVTFRVVRNS